MDQRALDFAHAAAAAADMVELNRMFVSAVRAHRIDYFAYSVIEGSQLAARQLIATSYPLSWAEHYLNAGYAEIDPVVQEAIDGDQPFIWSATRSPAAARELFAEAAKRGIVSGLAVPLPLAGGGKAVMSLATGLSDGEFQALMRENASPLLTTVWIYHKTAAQLMGLERIRPEPLSQRELDILRWLGDGMPLEAIGDRLAIPPTSVRAHVESAGQRLGLCDCPVVRVVAEAARRGYI